MQDRVWVDKEDTGTPGHTGVNAGPGLGTRRTPGHQDTWTHRRECRNRSGNDEDTRTPGHMGANAGIGLGPPGTLGH